MRKETWEEDLKPKESWVRTGGEKTGKGYSRTDEGTGGPGGHSDGQWGFRG